MDTETVIANLKKTRSTIGYQKIPNRSGIYAIYLKEGSDIKGYSISVDGFIYIGSTVNLKDRGYENHFNSDSTGFSTLRRTIGAIMKEELGIKAIPRRSGASETNFINYKFFGNGDNLLTNWMINNLEIGFCPIFEDYEKIEKLLIVLLQPILNLKGWDNPYKRRIMELRNKCAIEARKSCAV